MSTQTRRSASRWRHLSMSPGVCEPLERRVFLSAELVRDIGVVKRAARGQADEPVNRETFVCRFDRSAWKAALERDGSYMLRASMPWEDFPADMEKRAPVLWEWYMQLVRVEEAFKTLKSDLDLRPIHHQVQPRVEAHVLVAFLGYCLSATLRMKLKRSAPGLTPRAALTSLSRIQMVEVQIPTTDGRVLILPRHTEPEAEQAMILEQLGMASPAQPPPRIRQVQFEQAITAQGHSGVTMYCRLSPKNRVLGPEKSGRPSEVRRLV